MSSGDQIHCASPLKITNSAIVARITVSGILFSNGRMITRSVAAPRTNAITIVVKNAGQNEKPWFAISVQAMYVVNIAISPCAKLRTWVVR